MITHFSPLSISTVVSIAIAATNPMLAQEGAKERGILQKTYFFEKAAKEMEYVLYIPTKYDDSRKCPLLVLLHDHKSSPATVIKYSGITAEAEARGYIVAAPDGYNGRGWYGSRGKGKRGKHFGWKEDPENLGELSELDVLNVLEIVKNEFAVDEQRIYLMGHGMGGGGTLHLAMTNPDIWAGLAPLSPSFYSGPEVLSALKPVPTIVATGESDEYVSVETVRRIVAQLAKNDAQHRYVEIEDGDHHDAIAQDGYLISQVFDYFDGKFAGEGKSLGEVYRTFTNSNGKTINAHLASATEDSVSIKRMNDGKLFALPVESLSLEDQAYVANWRKNKAEKESIAALEDALHSEPDPALESKLRKRLGIDQLKPKAAIKALSLEIEKKEKEVNALDDRAVAAFRQENATAGRNLQVKAIAAQQELLALRGLRSELRNADSEASTGIGP